MTTRPRSSLYTSLGLLLAVSAVAAAGYHLTSARQAYSEAEATRAEAERLAAEIQTLRRQPGRVMQESRSDRALARAIEKAASESGIDTARVTLIEPQTPRRAGDSPYTEHATTVQLESISLKQLASLAATLRASKDIGEGLEVTFLRVYAPYESASKPGSAELWNIEMTLTYLVYAPRSTRPVGGA